jgi:hypothetical protein
MRRMNWSLRAHCLRAFLFAPFGPPGAIPHNRHSPFGVWLHHYGWSGRSELLRHGMRRSMASYTRRGRVADRARHHLGAETSDPRNNALTRLACSFEHIVRGPPVGHEHCHSACAWRNWKTEGQRIRLSLPAQHLGLNVRVTRARRSSALVPPPSPGCRSARNGPLEQRRLPGRLRQRVGQNSRRN